MHVPRASYFKGGVSGDLIFLHGLVAGLRERGHELEIVSRVDVRDYSRGRVPARRLLSEARAVRRLTKRFAPDAWLVYGARANHPDLFGWWQRRRRYVLVSAGLGSGEDVPRPWRYLFRFAHRRSLARGDRVLVYRPKAVRSLLSAGVPEERLGVLPLAVASWQDIPDQQTARRQLGLPPEAPVILCVSRLPAPKKDGRPWKTELVVQVVNAMAGVPAEALLLIVGDGPGRTRVEARVAELGLEERVRLAGDVPNSDLAAYYAACDVFALPDLLERPWLAVLEAQSCGRPVVTTDTGASRVTVDAGRTGLLARDLDEFRAYLSELASDRARCRQMGEEGRRYIASVHSLGVRIAEIEKMLQPTR